LTLTEIGTLIDALTDMADENMRVAPDIDDLLRKLEAKWRSEDLELAMDHSRCAHSPGYREVFEERWRGEQSYLDALPPLQPKMETMPGLPQGDDPGTAS